MLNNLSNTGLALLFTAMAFWVAADAFWPILTGFGR